MPDPLIVAGAKVLTKYAATGVGSIIGPIFASWRASKEGKAELISAKYRAEVRLIEAKAEAEVLALVSSTQEEILHSAEQGVESARGGLEVKGAGITQAIEFQTLKRIANASSVIEDAADQLEDEEVVDHEPDPDWTARYFGHVQDVSSEDLRRIWASILSGEIKNPGQTSLRTLDVLRNMTISDARMFETICTFMMRNDFVFRAPSVNDIEGLSYSILLHLQDCGLVTVGPFLKLTLNFTIEGNIIIFGQTSTLLISSEEESPEPLEVPIFSVTAAGQELASIVSCSLSEDYLSSFATFLQGKNCKLYYLHNVVRNPVDSTITFSRKCLIEPR